MYAQLIKDKFPQDERAGLYKAPHLPAVKLGKVLRKDTRIASPTDVLALHIHDGIFGSSTVILTADTCYYDKGSFLLEDVKEFQAKGDDCTVFVNQKTQLIPHTFSVKNEQVAQTLQRIFQDIAYLDPKADKMVQNAYEGFSTTELDWLNMRDEVMRTIDMLYARYNDGKLNMLEYEEKKAELLARL